MALLGTGAICIWNDITAEGRAEFYDWHLNEHMPERAAIPGFLRSRRFIAADAGTKPEFFTLYETADPTILTSAAYLARLNAPTEWTRRATQAFRNTSRALTTVHASVGPGAGGYLGTLRFDVDPDRRDATITDLAEKLLPRIRDLPDMAGLHLCLTDTAASASRTTESRDRTDIQAAPNWVLIIEACSPAATRAALSAIQAHLSEAGIDHAPIAGLYRFEFQC